MKEEDINFNIKVLLFIRSNHNLKCLFYRTVSLKTIFKVIDQQLIYNLSGQHFIINIH